MGNFSNGWQVKSLVELVGKTGLMIDGDWVESKDQDPKGEIRLIQLADIGDGKYLNVSKRFLTKEKAEELKCTYLHQGDVLIARMPDPLGRACIFPGDEKTCITVVDVCVIRPDSRIADNKFLMYNINTNKFRNLIKKYISGTTRARISRSNLEKIKIPLPPLPIQKQIAEILEKADQAKQKRKEANKLTDEFLQSVFIEMFGDPVKNPKGWEVKILDDCCTKITDGEHLNPKLAKVGEYMITAMDVREEGIDFSRNNFVSESDFIKFTKKCSPEKNDLLLVSRGATIGRCCVINTDRKFCLMGSVILIKPKSITPAYLLYLFRDRNFLKYLLKLSPASAQQAIYIVNIKTLNIPVPPLSLQQQFAEIVNKTETLKEKQKQSARELENLFQSLMQRAFKGGVVS